MTRLSRENFLITGFVCILFGASMSVAGLGPMAITVGLFGVVFFLVGMSLGRQTGLSPEAIANWQPDGERLPRQADSCFVWMSPSMTPYEPPFCAVHAAMFRWRTVIVLPRTPAHPAVSNCGMKRNERASRPRIQR